MNGGGGEQTKIITLNVGGRVFSTTLTTLLSHPDSVLARMFSNDGSAVMPPAMTDASGHYFIDRDPDAFAVILNYLRSRLIWYSNIATASGTCRLNP